MTVPVVVTGQDVESRPDAVTRGVAEWSVIVSAARGIDLLQSSGGERYAMPTLSWGRVLTDLRGPGWARGRFEWAVEVTPVFVEWSSGRARGVGLAPLQWRWNLTPRGRLYPFAEIGGGALWTTDPIPRGTTGSNFMTHAGVGFRVLAGGGGGLVAGYRLHHISNGNRLRQNPGVNAHMLVVGYTRVSPR
jgi:Lipid A 3-O-deacylase (PagL)